MRYKRKTKQNRKKQKVYFHAEKHRMCTQKIRKSQYTQKINRVTEYWNIQYFVLDKWNVAKVHYHWEFFSCRRFYLSFHLNVKEVENLILSGIEDHTFGPTNLREHFPVEELILGKNRFLEVASLVKWSWIELSGIKYSSKWFGSSLLW